MMDKSLFITFIIQAYTILSYQNHDSSFQQRLCLVSWVTNTNHSFNTMALQFLQWNFIFKILYTLNAWAFPLNKFCGPYTSTIYITFNKIIKFYQANCLILDSRCAANREQNLYQQFQQWWYNMTLLTLYKIRFHYCKMVVTCKHRIGIRGPDICRISDTFN